ncbi:MAG: hypothetical protein V3U82_00920 [Robiginitomaculum sp.]
MPALRLLAATISGLAFVSVAPAAFAGCGTAASGCAPSVAYSSSPYQTAPMGVHYGQPYQHLRTVAFKQTPNVNVMRIQTGAPMAPLNRAPSNFWQNCGSNASGAPTPYCGVNAPRRMAPVPVARPVMAMRPAPVAYAAPRVYGDNTLTPGHAYVSHNTIVHRVAPVMAAPSYIPSYAPTYSAPYSAPVASPSVSVQGPYASAGGWKQVSGPTMIDGMLATKVVCKQPAPVAQAPVMTMQTRQRAYQVVRPVVEVRYPVAVQAPYAGPVCSSPVRGGRYGSSDNRRVNGGSGLLKTIGLAAISGAVRSAF